MGEIQKLVYKMEKHVTSLITGRGDEGTTKCVRPPYGVCLCNLNSWVVHSVALVSLKFKFHRKHKSLFHSLLHHSLYMFRPYLYHSLYISL
jgi:hypothetical protein